MHKRIFRSFFLYTLICSQLISSFWPIQLVAQESTDIDYNYIISDNDLFAYDSMSLNDIRDFLKVKNSTLINYVDPVAGVKAPDIIYRTAQDFKISPKFLLVLMQKEQSLIENASPSTRAYNWATGYGVCDGCSTDDPLIQKFRGFYNQVYNAGRRISEDYSAQLANSGRTIAGFGPGITKQVDGVPITPTNRATAILFTYTPHLKGNSLFGNLWNKYFSRNYPDGSLLNIEGDKYVWLIQNGQRRKFGNRGVFLSRYPDFNTVITINRTELLKYSEGPIIKFPNYSYIKIKGGATYLVVDDIVRVFADREAVRKVGVNPDEIITANATDLENYTEGEPITSKSIYPTGSLFKLKTGDLFWVQDGIKHPIPYLEIAKIRFGKRKATLVTKKQMDKYQLGDPLLFPDGILLTSNSDSNIYIISNSTRRRFVDENIFNDLGYDNKNVIMVNDAAMLLHFVGEPIIKNY